jgi:hypothetical protein
MAFIERHLPESIYSLKYRRHVMPSKEICRDGVGSNNTFQGSDTDYEVSSLSHAPPQSIPPEVESSD